MVHDVKYMKAINYYRRDGEPLHDYQITEKIDGANFRWVLADDPINHQRQIIFGSRNHMNILHTLIDETDDEWTEWELFDPSGATLGKGGSGGTFKRFARFVTEKVVEADLLQIIWEELGKFVFYGECVGSHKINYEHDPDRMVLGFDVYDTERHKYIVNWEYFMDLMNIPKVTYLNDDPHFTGKTPDQIWAMIQDEKWVKEIRSWYDGKSRIEGVMIKDYQNESFFKLKTKEFIEERMPKQKVSTWDGFVAKYVTPQRVEKTILKMQDGDLGFNPKNPFPSVVGHIIKDIIDEGMDDIVKVLKKELTPTISKTIGSEPEYMKLIMRLMKK